MKVGWLYAFALIPRISQELRTGLGKRPGERKQN